MKLHISFFIIFCTITFCLVGAQPAHDGLSREERIRAYYNRARADQATKIPKPETDSVAKPNTKKPSIGIPEKINLTHNARQRIHEIKQELYKPVIIPTDCSKVCAIGCDLKWQKMCEKWKPLSQKEKNEELKKIDSLVDFYNHPSIDGWTSVRCQRAALICAGADPNVQKYRLCSVPFNDYDYTKLELDHGANPNLPVIFRGHYDLSIFQLIRTVKMAQLLLSYNAHIPTKVIGYTLLEGAMFPAVEPALVAFYLQQGLNPNDGDRVPLHLLAHLCWQEAKKYSLADIKKKAQYLLDHGAKTTIKNSDGKTAQEVAEAHPNDFVLHDNDKCLQLATLLRRATQRQKIRQALNKLLDNARI